MRLLSKNGVCSRSKAKDLVASGRVSVNGNITKDPFQWVSLNAKIAVDGIKAVQQSKVLYSFYKPKGCVTTTSDEKNRKTVYDYLPEKLKHLKAIGRLDMATTGLLLFTNDNDFLNLMLDPNNKIEREYIVSVDGQITDTMIQVLSKGITDKDEILQCYKVEILKTSKSESHLKLILHEGKNREIRRMFLALGFEVTKLKRVRYGRFELGDLKLGEIRKCSYD